MSLRAPRRPTPQVVVARVNPFPLVILLGALFFASGARAHDGYIYQDYWAGGTHGGILLPLTPAPARYGVTPFSPVYVSPYSAYFTRSPVFVAPLYVGSFPTLYFPTLGRLGGWP